MRRLLLIALLPLVLALVWFFLRNKVSESEIPQDGTASLDFQGEHYDVPGIELLIYVTARADRDQIVELPKGQGHDFRFSIGASLKQQNDSTNKDTEWLFKNWRRVNISWDELQIQDPELLTGHKVNESDPNHLYMSLALPNHGLISDDPSRQNGWVQIDQISQGRAQGHFGGTFEDPKTLQPAEVGNGTFNVPIEKLYKYK